MSRCRPKNAKSLRPAYCQAVATAVRHVSNFASETCYGTIDARPNIIIVGRVGFGGRQEWSRRTVAMTGEPAVADGVIE